MPDNEGDPTRTHRILATTEGGEQEAFRVKAETRASAFRKAASAIKSDYEATKLPSDAKITDMSWMAMDEDHHTLVT